MNNCFFFNTELITDFFAEIVTCFFFYPAACQMLTHLNKYIAYTHKYKVLCSWGNPGFYYT